MTSDRQCGALRLNGSTTSPHQTIDDMPTYVYLLHDVMSTMTFDKYACIVSIEWYFKGRVDALTNQCKEMTFVTVWLGSAQCNKAAM